MTQKEYLIVGMALMKLIVLQVYNQYIICIETQLSSYAIATPKVIKYRFLHLMLSILLNIYIYVNVL